MVGVMGRQGAGVCKRRRTLVHVCLELACGMPCAFQVELADHAAYEISQNCLRQAGSPVGHQQPRTRQVLSAIR